MVAISNSAVVPLAACLIGVLAVARICQGAAPPPPVAVAPASAPAVPAPEVVFAASSLKTTVEPGVGVVELAYGFTNKSDLPLVVEEFVHSCGCMLGEWDGNPVEPGASGQIKARFFTQGLRGTVRKSLRVRFVELGTVELTAEVTIPEAIVYSSQTLRWRTGAPPEPQVIDVIVQSKAPIRVLSVSKNDGVFESTLAVLEEGRRYRITITPRDTSALRVGLFQVRTDAKDRATRCRACSRWLRGRLPRLRQPSQ